MSMIKNIAATHLTNARAIAKAFAGVEALPVFGLVYADVPTLVAAISATPADFPDGTPIFVSTINFNDPLSASPITESGWVIVYAHVPIPVSPPSDDHLERWITDYSTQSLTSSWIDQNDDGLGGFFTNSGGSPVPSQNIGMGGGVCPLIISGAEEDRIHPQGGSVGLLDWEVDQLSISVGAIISGAEEYRIHRQGGSEGLVDWGGAIGIDVGDIA
jgi:hypothetical protein